MKIRIKGLNLKKERLIIYTFMLLVIIFLIIVLSIYASSNFREFREDKDYFKENLNPSIDVWMTPSTILRHFEITEEGLFKELNVTKSESSLRTPLYKICAKKSINCSDLVEKLNRLVK